MTDEVMTLHELCDAFGISRRTVQGYEKHGLVRATGRNPRGYLLYDLQMQTEIQKVHQFQKFGFQVKEIGTLMMLSKPELRERFDVATARAVAALPAHSESYWSREAWSWMSNLHCLLK